MSESPQDARDPLQFGMPDPATRALRFRDAMPKPVLALFVLGGVVALGLAAWGLLRPPVPPLALQDRRPPSHGVFSHDAGRVVSAPLPRTIPSVPPPCDAVRHTRLIGGGDAIIRIGTVLQQICPLANGGVEPELARAIRGLDGASIRFGTFGRTGVESTADLSSRTIWLNIKFALRRTKPIDLAPVVLHEAWHLAEARAAITADTELGARAAEVQGCRHLIDTRQWPRWCHDANRLTALARAEAVRLLVSAGYPER